jgi:hypothetical protein
MHSGYYGNQSPRGKIKVKGRGKSSAQLGAERGTYGTLSSRSRIDRSNYPYGHLPDERQYYQDPRVMKDLQQQTLFAGRVPYNPSSNLDPGHFEAGQRWENPALNPDDDLDDILRCMRKSGALQ